MKILIATHNKDKFKVVSKILSETIFKNSTFKSINDLDNNFDEVKEQGDIINRSLQKAKNVYDNLPDNEFDYIVGVDDGIIMKNKMIENVKDYIKDIVEDNYLTQDEIVYIVRAYTFIDKNNYIKSIITKIPFKYIKLTSSFNIKEISYPLNHVLVPINSNKTISKMTEEESNNYYLIYSKDILMEVL